MIAANYRTKPVRVFAVRLTAEYGDMFDKRFAPDDLYGDGKAGKRIAEVIRCLK